MNTGRLDQLQRRMRHRGRFSKPSLSRGYGLCSAMGNEMILRIYEEFGKQRAQNLRTMLRLRPGRRVQERPPQTASRCSARRSGTRRMNFSRSAI